MKTTGRFLLLLALFAWSMPAFGAESSWESMRTGMNREQVARALGVPVLQNAGRGHETWIYDAGASVQFRGGVVSAWTAPKATAVRVARLAAPAARPVS